MPTSVNPETRPPHLHRGGRDIRPAFPPDETLYRRCLPEHVLDGRVLAEAFQFPDLSVLRSSECRDPDDARWISVQELKPGETLVVYDDWSVVGIRVGDVPNQVEGENGGKDYDVAIKHVPYDDLFPHSEIRLIKDGVHVQRSNKIPALIKRKIRDRIAASAVEIAKPKS